MTKKTLLPSLLVLMLLPIFATAGEFEKVFKLEKRIRLDDKEGRMWTIGRITFDKKSNIYSNDLSAIYKFNHNGEYLRTIGQKGEGPGEFEMISNIAFDSKGRIHTFDKYKRAVQVFSADGEFLDSKKLENEWDQIFFGKDDQVYLERRAKTDECKFIMYTDNFSKKKCLLSESGAFDFKVFTYSAFDVDFDKAGNVYAADGLEYKVHVFNSKGKRIRTIGSPCENFRQLKTKPPLPMGGKSFNEWWKSFSSLGELQILPSGHLLVYYNYSNDKNSRTYVDIYKVSGRKITSVEVPKELSEAGRDHEGYVYFSKTDISDDGAEVNYWLYKYSLNEKYLKAKMKGK